MIVSYNFYYARPGSAAAVLQQRIKASDIRAQLGLPQLHAGVEQHWWQGPQACSGRIPAGLSAEELKKLLLGARMVRCDEIPWKLFNISMAGWNAILSGGLAILLSLNLIRRLQAES